MCVSNLFLRLLTQHLDLLFSNLALARAVVKFQQTFVLCYLVLPSGGGADGNIQQMEKAWKHLASQPVLVRVFQKQNQWEPEKERD